MQLKETFRTYDSKNCELIDLYKWINWIYKEKAFNRDKMNIFIYDSDKLEVLAYIFDTKRLLVEKLTKLTDLKNQTQNDFTIRDIINKHIININTALLNLQNVLCEIKSENCEDFEDFVQNIKKDYNNRIIMTDYESLQKAFNNIQESDIHHINQLAHLVLLEMKKTFNTYNQLLDKKLFSLKKDDNTNALKFNDKMEEYNLEKFKKLKEIDWGKIKKFIVELKENLTLWQVFNKKFFNTRTYDNTQQYENFEKNIHDITTNAENLTMKLCDLNNSLKNVRGGCKGGFIQFERFNKVLNEIDYSKIKKYNSELIEINNIAYDLLFNVNDAIIKWKSYYNIQKENKNIKPIDAVTPSSPSQYIDNTSNTYYNKTIKRTPGVEPLYALPNETPNIDIPSPTIEQPSSSHRAPPLPTSVVSSSSHLTHVESLYSTPKLRESPPLPPRSPLPPPVPSRDKKPIIKANLT
jgi:hypothetical protein